VVSGDVLGDPSAEALAVAHRVAVVEAAGDAGQADLADDLGQAPVAAAGRGHGAVDGQPAAVGAEEDAEGVGERGRPAAMG
jgi:hypothetical protein